MSAMIDQTKFHVGMRVKMTPLALDQVLQGIKVNRRTGTVKGYGNEPQLIRVRRDGDKFDKIYHVDFWEPMNPPLAIAPT